MLLLKVLTQVLATVKLLILLMQNAQDTLQNTSR